MGKYMKKAKPTAEVAVMDLYLGVRTRAKTLALQRQSSSSARLPPAASPPPVNRPPPPSPPAAPSYGYLQLRSRRLLKPPVVLHDSKRQRQGQGQGHRHNKKEEAEPNPSSKAGACSSRLSSSSTGSGSRRSSQRKEVNRENKQEEAQAADTNNNNNSNSKSNDSKDLGVEASFGENALDFEVRERSTRESTPCSLIRDPETIRTPCSTTRPTSTTETNRRIQSSTRTRIPTASEMDEFFARSEEEQQKQFIEKYNFDPVNDKPLPGRFKWEKLDP